MNQDTIAIELRGGFFAETAQTAVASYLPQLPEGQRLQPYLRSLVDEAKDAVGVSYASDTAA